ncbi:phage tail protein [Methylorubrum rhodesianum]|uniref:phage tail protein n=1 Tax=Methylorubrum rhodesianum TaxID=29427 RepID=UPI00374522A8
MTGLIDFSIFASENGAAAPPVNFQEGMPANAVNNSAREMMAALARWRGDDCGILGASVSGGAVAITTFQGIKPGHFGGAFRLSFALPVENTGPLTLNVDSTGPRPWRRQQGFEFAPGDVPILVTHDVIWVPVIGAFISRAPTFETPGRIGAYATPNAIPPGWVECDGREVSRVSYAALFSVIGTAYGGGNGSTTFNVPDLRGRALFGRDNGAGRLTGAGGLGGNVNNTGGSETVVLNDTQMPSHSHFGTTGEAGAHDHTGGTGQAGQHSHGGVTGNSGAHNHTGTTGGSGSHSHGGTTSSSGTHTHDLAYTKLAIYGGGGGLTAVSEMFPPSVGNSTAQVGGAGEHQHSIATDSVGDHSHNFSTSGVGDHAHVIGADGNHAHAIPGVGHHTHVFSTSNAGGGLAHSNMPPGLVGVFAIKG